MSLHMTHFHNIILHGSRQCIYIQNTKYTVSYLNTHVTKTLHNIIYTHDVMAPMIGYVILFNEAYTYYTHVLCLYVNAHVTKTLHMT